MLSRLMASSERGKRPEVVWRIQSRPPYAPAGRGRWVDDSYRNWNTPETPKRLSDATERERALNYFVDRLVLLRNEAEGDIDSAVQPPNSAKGRTTRSSSSSSNRCGDDHGAYVAWTLPHPWRPWPRQTGGDGQLATVERWGGAGGAAPPPAPAPAPRPKRGRGLAARPVAGPRARPAPALEPGQHVNHRSSPRHNSAGFWRGRRESFSPPAGW
jgi:hypothetical protein